MLAYENSLAILDAVWDKCVRSKDADTVYDYLQNVDQVCKTNGSFGAVSLEVVWNSFGQSGEIDLWKNSSHWSIEADEDSSRNEVGKHELSEGPILHSFAHAHDVAVHAVVHLVVLPAAVKIVKQLK